MRAPTLLHLPLLALVACGADDEPGSPDGRPDAAPGTIDAVASDDDGDLDGSDGMPDGMPDAEPAPDAMTASVIEVDCDEVDDPLQLTTGGGRFVPEGTLAIPVDGVVRFFRTSGSHNFASAPDNPPGKQWRSGPPGHVEPACFRFTAAGDYPFVCEPHAATMFGVVRVE